MLKRKHHLSLMAEDAWDVLRGAAMQAARHQSRSEWGLARDGWARAIACTWRPLRHADRLAWYELNLGICEFFLRDVEAAGRHLKAAELSPAVRQRPELLLLKARLLRPKDPAAAQVLLEKGLAIAPNDTAILYELASVMLDGPDPAHGLPLVARLVDLRPNDVSFRLLASDLAERTGLWAQARLQMEQAVARDPKEPQNYERLIRFCGLTGDIVAARHAALAFMRVFPGEYIVLQQLLVLYEQAGEYRQARLICRFLMRMWPHAAWHKYKYAELTALSGSLNEADRVLAAVDVAADQDAQYNATLWRVAQSARGRHEALARLEFVRAAGPSDFETELAYGYALADVKGPEPARTHFYQLSIRRKFNARVMHGLAHMAVRERVASATLAAWRRAYEVNFGDGYALREYCRALFETGEADQAMALADMNVARFRHNRAFVEFHVWLSTAVGHFGDTLDDCEAGLKTYANPWQFLESWVTCAAFIGKVDDLDRSSDGAKFYVAQFDDVARAYSIMRLLSIHKKEHLLVDKFDLTGNVVVDHAWLHRLRRRPDTAPATPQLSENLYGQSQFAAMVDGGPSRDFEDIPDQRVSEILTRAGRGARKIYIFSKFEQARGGSELHALDLAERLRDYAEVELWAPTMCHSSFIKAGMVRVIDPANGDLPAPGGIVVLVGLYFDLGPYMAQVDPYRIVALYNTFEAPAAMRRVESLYKTTGRKVEVLYCSRMMGAELGLPGVFEPSPTDLKLFRPALAEPERFVIGKHSRDVIEKHHPDDARVYRAVSALGGRSVILGGVCMKKTFGQIDGLDLLPATNKGIGDFLQALSCYYYRTGTWVEPWGRVVIEALACGVPVVAHRLGGYAEAIDHGWNGFLFDETDEAIAHITRLHADPELRRHMARNARASAEAIVGPAAMRRLAAYYLYEPQREGMS